MIEYYILYDIYPYPLLSSTIITGCATPEHDMSTLTPYIYHDMLCMSTLNGTMI